MPRRSTCHHRCALLRTAVRLAGATALLAVVSVPMRSVEAQSSIVSPVRFEAFGARNESATTATFGGLSLAGYAGIFGLRLGGSVAGLDLGGDNTVSSAPVRGAVCGARPYCARNLERRRRAI